MAIQVTYSKLGKTSRKTYRTANGAVKSMRNWLQVNKGIVIAYWPGGGTEAYTSYLDLPEPKEENRTDFYRTKAWRDLRFKVLNQEKPCCAVCGRGRQHEVVLHVDHIKPRSKYPELALDITNLQILCEDCNSAKGSSDG